METQLILNDGTIIDGGRAGLTDINLWLWLPGWTMADAAAAAFNPARMRKIWFKAGDAEEEYNGFTVCETITQDGNEIALCMVQGG